MGVSSENIGCADRPGDTFRNLEAPRAAYGGLGLGQARVICTGARAAHLLTSEKLQRRPRASGERQQNAAHTRSQRVPLAESRARIARRRSECSTRPGRGTVVEQSTCGLEEQNLCFAIPWNKTRTVLIAPLGADIRTAHMWTQRHATCDALSWLHTGEEPDLKILRHATRMPRANTPHTLLSA